MLSRLPGDPYGPCRSCPSRTGRFSIATITSTSSGATRPSTAIPPVPAVSPNATTDSVPPDATHSTRATRTGARCITRPSITTFADRVATVATVPSVSAESSRAIPAIAAIPAAAAVANGRYTVAAVFARTTTSTYCNATHGSLDPICTRSAISAVQSTATRRRCARRPGVSVSAVAQDRRVSAVAAITSSLSRSCDATWAAPSPNHGHRCVFAQGEQLALNRDRSAVSPTSTKSASSALSSDEILCAQYLQGHEKNVSTVATLLARTCCIQSSSRFE